MLYFYIFLRMAILVFVLENSAASLIAMNINKEGQSFAVEQDVSQENTLNAQQLIDPDKQNEQKIYVPIVSDQLNLTKQHLDQNAQFQQSQNDITDNIVIKTQIHNQDENKIFEKLNCVIKNKGLNQSNLFLPFHLQEKSPINFFGKQFSFFAIYFLNNDPPLNRESIQKRLLQINVTGPVIENLLKQDNYVSNIIFETKKMALINKIRIMFTANELTTLYTAQIKDDAKLTDSEKKLLSRMVEELLLVEYRMKLSAIGELDLQKTDLAQEKKTQPLEIEKLEIQQEELYVELFLIEERLYMARRQRYIQEIDALQLDLINLKYGTKKYEEHELQQKQLILQNQLEKTELNYNH
jgi:hypothetical protein